MDGQARKTRQMFIADQARTSTDIDTRRPDARPDSIIQWEPERGSIRTSSALLTIAIYALIAAWLFTAVVAQL